MLLDTGPLVAWLDGSDQWHEKSVRMATGVKPPLLTCEPVLTETCFLLQNQPQAIDEVARWLESGFIRVAFSLEKRVSGVFRLVAKYRDMPMSLGDACLVAMLESGLGDRIFTLDDHFRIYRHSGRRVVPVLMPD